MLEQSYFREELGVLFDDSTIGRLLDAFLRSLEIAEQGGQHCEEGVDVRCCGFFSFL